jgi:hypothetical protein
MSVPLTTREYANLRGVNIWAVRRALDALPGGAPRVGLYSVIPPDLVPRLDAALRERGYLRGAAEAGHA